MQLDPGMGLGGGLTAVARGKGYVRNREAKVAPMDPHRKLRPWKRPAARTRGRAP